MKSKCAPHLPTFAPLFGIVSPLSTSLNTSTSSSSSSSIQVRGLPVLRTVLVVGLNSLSLPLSLHSAVACWRRPSAYAITLTSSTFTSSSFATPVSSSSSASSSSAAARPCCATAKQAR